MEAVEITVYLLVAFAVGGLIIAVLTSFDVIGLSDTTRGLFGLGEEDHDIVRSTNESIAGDLYTAWEDCGYGAENETRIFQFDSSITFAQLFDTYEKLNLCDTMRSENQSCGRGETLNITSGGTTTPIAEASIDGPTIIVATCNTQTKQLDVEVSS